MELQYQCTKEDYLQAQNAHARGSWIFVALMGLALVLIAVGVLQSVTMGITEGLPALAVGIFWLACKFVLRPLSLLRDFRKNPTLAMAQEAVISEDGFRTVGALGGSDVKWSAFTKSRETRNLFILSIGTRLFQVIPKRALSVPQLDEVRELLLKKLPTQ